MFYFKNIIQITFDDCKFGSSQPNLNKLVHLDLNLLLIQPLKMKLISYIAIICVILGITTLSLTCYFVRPMEGPISCKALSEANQPKSAVPFFSQGFVFAAGIVFFIVVTAIGEWTQNQSEDDIVPDEKMNKWEEGYNSRSNST